jgi:UDP-2,4-diacetamido-2,4,6-trideoxy-beta-L-altropyranose hydrolase
MKKAFFMFEGSPNVGAGHAIRCSVLADALIEAGWHCTLITSEATYDFITDLKRFDRLDPQSYSAKPIFCDILVIDNYNLAFAFEQSIRPYTEKIVVIDDLANRIHDCDVLLDPTYRRQPIDYYPLVPKQCIVLVGSDYVLLRKAFTKLRHQSFLQHQRSGLCKRVLISMGGGRATNHELKALYLLEQAHFKGTVDLVLGFSAQGIQALDHQLRKGTLHAQLHSDPDMALLIYQSDLVIGAAGSSVWERCILGVKQYLFKIAANQNSIFNLFPQIKIATVLQNNALSQQEKKLSFLVDGLGALRIVHHLEGHRDKLDSSIRHEKIKIEDLELIYQWQQDESVRRHAMTPQAPSFNEHKQWFLKQMSRYDSVFEKILCDGVSCGALRLDYRQDNNSYLLSWYLISKYQHRGIGPIMLEFAKRLAFGRPIYAFTLKDNRASHQALINAGFLEHQVSDGGTEYIF